MSEIEEDKNHPCHPKKILQLINYEGGVIQTNAPIIGVLVQPYTHAKESSELSLDKNNFFGTYLPVAHVKFLEAAGARVVPVNYRVNKATLRKLLG